MQIHVKRLSWEPIVEHDFPTDERFEWQSRKHIESEAESCHVDHNVVGWEVVENISFGERTEG